MSDRACYIISVTSRICLRHDDIMIIRSNTFFLPLLSSVFLIPVNLVKSLNITKMNTAEQENVSSDDNLTSMRTYVYITFVFSTFCCICFLNIFAVYSSSNHLIKENLPNRFMKQTCNQSLITSLMDQMSHPIL